MEDKQKLNPLWEQAGKRHSKQGEQCSQSSTWRENACGEDVREPKTKSREAGRTWAFRPSRPVLFKLFPVCHVLILLLKTIKVYYQKINNWKTYKMQAPFFPRPNRHKIIIQFWIILPVTIKDFKCLLSICVTGHGLLITNRHSSRDHAFWVAMLDGKPSEDFKNG